MSLLTDHQMRALEAYEALLAEKPNLFAGRASRPIIKDRELIAAYAAEHKLVLGVAARTPYSVFVIDLVQSRLPDGSIRRYPYQRILSRAQLVGGSDAVALATIENPALGPVGSIVVLDQDRHATGTCETELPRGFGESGLSGELNALRELEEETGYVGDHARLLAATYTDSGTTDVRVSFYHIPVVRKTEQRLELGEAIRRVYLATPEQLWDGIRSGKIRDAFTVQALALYEKCPG